MQSIVKKLLASSLLLCLPLVTGCGKEGNPVAPEAPVAPAAPESLDVTVTLGSLYAVADGDGIEGPGDFAFETIVYDGASGHTLDVTGFEHIETGSSYDIGRTRVIRVPKNQNYRIVVKFIATEWDGDILGRSWPDTRMDNLWDQRVHTDASRTATFNDGERSITLGEGDLRLRLYYTITSKPVV